MGSTVLTRRLEVIGGTKLVVPGLEPVSDVSSRTLLAQWDGTNSLLDVHVALAAIPGSKLVYGDNWAGVGMTAGAPGAWFELPPEDQDCCCGKPDYYRVLKELAKLHPAPPPAHPECAGPSWNRCPSEFNAEPPPPEPSPYLAEHANVYDSVGVLPLFPPWMIKPPEAPLDIERALRPVICGKKKIPRRPFGFRAFLDLTLWVKQS